MMSKVPIYCTCNYIIALSPQTNLLGEKRKEHETCTVNDDNVCNSLQLMEPRAREKKKKKN
jgi:hypothetical protein